MHRKADDKERIPKRTALSSRLAIAGAGSPLLFSSPSESNPHEREVADALNGLNVSKARDTACGAIGLPRLSQRNETGLIGTNPGE